MIPNSNYSPIPFYMAESQLDNMKDYAYGYVYPNSVSKTKLLPFQIVRDDQSGDPVTSVLLRRRDGSSVDITSAIAAVGLTVIEHTEYDVITYPGAYNMAALTEGQAQLVISDGTYTWYSGWFFIVNSLTERLKLTFYNSDNLVFPGGVIDYTSPYTNILYFDGVVALPKYTTVIEVTETEGYKFREKIISHKVYSFQAIVPEYIADLVRLAALADVVEIADKGYTYTAMHVSVDYGEWFQNGLLVPMTVSFEVDAIVRAYGLLGEYTGKDYNIDFNPDFLI